MASCLEGKKKSMLAVVEHFSQGVEHFCWLLKAVGVVGVQHSAGSKSHALFPILLHPESKML